MSACRKHLLKMSILKCDKAQRKVQLNIRKASAYLRRLEFTGGVRRTRTADLFDVNVIFSSILLIVMVLYHPMNPVN
jgi:hypothetical protein